MEIGLALSGGGAFGFAHVGVLKALEERHIPISYISGTSMGAAIAAFYAAGYSAQELTELWKHIPWQEPWGKLPQWMSKTMALWRPKGGLLVGTRLEQWLHQRLKDKGVERMEQLPMPLAMPAVDLISGKTVYFVKDKKGLTDSRDAVYHDNVMVSQGVRASLSYPGLFQPKELLGYRLADGGLRVNVPCGVLRRMGAHKVLAVYTHGKGNTEMGDGIWGVVSRSIDLLGQSGGNLELSLADVVVQLEGDHVGLLDFTKAQEAMELGYEQAIGQMDEIERRLYFS